MRYRNLSKLIDKNGLLIVPKEQNISMNLLCKAAINLRK